MYQPYADDSLTFISLFLTIGEIIRREDQLLQVSLHQYTSWRTGLAHPRVSHSSQTGGARGSASFTTCYTGLGSVLPADGLLETAVLLADRLQLETH